jgi:nucleoid-associated protein YgaU
MNQPFFNTISNWETFDQPDLPLDDLSQTPTNEPARYIFVDVKPGEQLADLARRVYGTNNVINRMKIEMANGGNICGTIRCPK